MTRSTAADIRSSIDATAFAAGHQLDEHQHAATDALAAFGETVMAQKNNENRPAGGLYLWGTVGRGKTWLADAFFTALPLEAKRRVHFHAFYRQLQQELYRDGIPSTSALDTAIDGLLNGIDLLYFDEFHLHDAGDAMLALKVLRVLMERRVPLLATSNYPPHGLLPDPIYHHLFLPGIDLIVQNLNPVALAGDTDYRRTATAEEARVGFARGTWRPPGQLPAPQPHEATTLGFGGRNFPARRATEGELWLTFDQLCEAPTAASDYLEWADAYPHWVIEGVPRLTTCSPQARQRFLNAVDVLNDRGVQVEFVSELSPEQVLEGGPAPTARGAAADREELGLGLDGLPIDVARTASRLALLRQPVRRE